MKTAAKRAKRMPAFELAFRNLYLNQRVDAKSPLIPRAEWMGCQQEGISIEAGSGIYMGLDLSRTTDLTALVAVSDGEKDIVKSWFWKPEDLLLEHERIDRVPYWAWKQSGYIETSPGRAIEYEWVAHKLDELNQQYNILGIAFDRKYIEHFLKALDNEGVESYRDNKKDKPNKFSDKAIRMVDWGQGWFDMPPAINALEISILNRKLIHDGNPCLTWNISNAMAIPDPAGNRKFDKSASRFRIDGAVALAMAIGLKSRDLAEGPVISIYNDLTDEQIKQRLAF